MMHDALSATYAKAFPTSRAWSATEFAALLIQSGTFLCGSADGFVIVRVIADEAEIITLATDPAHRRQGRARAALIAAHAQAKEAGAASIFLEVAEDNAPAKALYANFGYQQVGRRPGYYQRTNTAPVAALVLRFDLNSA